MWNRGLLIDLRAGFYPVLPEYYMKLLNEYFSKSTILYCITSILLAVLLIGITCYTQEEIHRQGLDLYEFSFCFLEEEQIIPEFMYEDKEGVTLLCYERHNPMDYTLLSGAEERVVLEENYETINRGKKRFNNVIFRAVSNRKKALENAVSDWANALEKEGNELKECEDRRITAGGLLGSDKFIYLLYGIAWIVLLAFQMGNLMMYVKGRRKTVEIYMLLGIPRYTLKMKKNIIILYIFFTVIGLVFLKGYCPIVFAFLIFLFYLIIILFGCIQIKLTCNINNKNK